MQTETRQVIPVRFSVPYKSLLSTEIDFRRDDKGAARNADCYRDASLLIELASGFWGRGADKNYISPELRKSIRGYSGKGEWTADHVDYDAETPAGVVVPKGYVMVDWIQLADKIKGSRAEGGSRKKVELPPEGWQIPVRDGQEFRMYHPATGSPLATVPRSEKDKATKALKDAGFDEKDVSYFWRACKGAGTRAVYRFYNAVNGPFDVGAYDGPDSRGDDLGVRLASRSEPLRSKGDDRGILVAVPEKEYETLLEARRQRDEVRSLVNPQ